MVEARNADVEEESDEMGVVVVANTVIYPWAIAA
jgi:hypothetical protein